MNTNQELAAMLASVMENKNNIINQLQKTIEQKNKEIEALNKELKGVDENE